MQVTITRNVPTNFLKVLDPKFSTIKITRSAVAMTTASNQTPCVICVLNPKAAGALADSGSGGIYVTNGGIVVDSSSATALQLSGSGSIQGDTVGIVGGYTDTGSGTLQKKVLTGIAPVPDPLAKIPQPPLGGYSSCPSISLSDSNNQTITPGCYQNLDLSGSGSLILKPGLYVITGAINLSGSGAFNASAGVTMFFTCGGSTPTYCIPGQAGGTLNMSGSGSFNPQQTGPYQGMVFFFDRNNISGINLSGSGGINGTIYGKSATMNISGSGGSYNSNSLVVVDRLQMSGSGGISDNFTAAQNAPVSVPGASKLVQ